MYVYCLLHVLIHAYIMYVYCVLYLTIMPYILQLKTLFDNIKLALLEKHTNK